MFWSDPVFDMRSDPVFNMRLDLGVGSFSRVGSDFGLFFNVRIRIRVVFQCSDPVRR